MSIKQNRYLQNLRSEIMNSKEEAIDKLHNMVESLELERADGVQLISRYRSNDKIISLVGVVAVDDNSNSDITIINAEDTYVTKDEFNSVIKELKELINNDTSNENVSTIELLNYDYLMINYCLANDEEININTITVMSQFLDKNNNVVEINYNDYSFFNKEIGYGYTNSLIDNNGVLIYSNCIGNNSGKEDLYLNIKNIFNIEILEKLFSKNVAKVRIDLYGNVYDENEYDKKISVSLHTMKGGEIIFNENYISASGEVTYISKDFANLNSTGINKWQNYKTDYTHIGYILCDLTNSDIKLYIENPLCVNVSYNTTNLEDNSINIRYKVNGEVIDEHIISSTCTKQLCGIPYNTEVEVECINYKIYDNNGHMINSFLYDYFQPKDFFLKKPSLLESITFINNEPKDGKIVKYVDGNAIYSITLDEHYQESGEMCSGGAIYNIYFYSGTWINNESAFIVIKINGDSPINISSYGVKIYNRDIDGIYIHADRNSHCSCTITTYNGENPIGINVFFQDQPYQI